MWPPTIQIPVPRQRDPAASFSSLPPSQSHTTSWSHILLYLLLAFSRPLISPSNVDFDPPISRRKHPLGRLRFPRQNPSGKSHRRPRSHPPHFVIYRPAARSQRLSNTANGFKTFQSDCFLFKTPRLIWISIVPLRPPPILPLDLVGQHRPLLNLLLSNAAIPLINLPRP